MIKAALIPVVLAALLFCPATGSAQDAPVAPTPPPQDAAAAPVTPAVSAADNATALAAQEAVKKQADTIDLQNKLVDAQATVQRGDVAGAAKLYQECYDLSQQIGPGIPMLTQQAVDGLASTCMVLAKNAQSNGDYREANVRVMQVLKANPKNQEAIAFKARNDQMLAAQIGHVPDSPTIDRSQQIQQDQIQAGTLAQDGKLLFEMGKIDEAQAKLEAAIKLDPDNKGASYYLELIGQMKYQRATEQHNIDTETRIAQVEKQWVLPKASTLLPTPNPYATNSLIYTGPGRQSIIAKLNSIRLDDVNFDGLPLNEVLRQLSEQSKLRDPERKGINFLINPNPDLSGPPIAVSGTGFGGEQGGGFGGAPTPPTPAAAQIDPNTGLPIAGGGAAGGGGGGGEGFDLGTAVTVKLTLNDERLLDVLDAIVLVAEHPPGHQIKYSVQDFGVVFEDKGEQTPQLFTRTFKVDPNTFFSGLESVGSSSFGSVSSSGSGGSGGSGGGGGGSSGGQNGQNGGAVVGVVNAFSGAGSLRNQGGSGGGGGGGGGGGQGASNPLNAGQPGQGGGAGGGSSQNQGGLNYVTQITLEQQVSAAARAFFTSLGVNLLAPPGKSVFFNERSGILLVRATEQDLDTIDKAIQALNSVAPQVHIKARFIEVQQTDNKQMGFDWYLGQFNLGDKVVGQGGNPGSVIVPNSPANPLGAFPGATVGQLLPDGGQQIFNSGLASGATGATTATITGILTNPNFQVVMHMMDQRSGIETLAEPEVVTTSGRQTQMRATQVITVVTGVGFQQGTAATTTTGTGTTP